MLFFLPSKLVTHRWRLKEKSISIELSKNWIDKTKEIDDTISDGFGITPFIIEKYEQYTKSKTELKPHINDRKYDTTSGCDVAIMYL